MFHEHFCRVTLLIISVPTLSLYYNLSTLATINNFSKLIQLDKGETLLYTIHIWYGIIFKAHNFPYIKLISIKPLPEIKGNIDIICVQYISIVIIRTHL